jgi:ribA/ribD-fused uncharacterized protein
MKPTTSIEGFRGQYRFLSNFYPCSISYEGVIYPTVEHAYQAAKSTSMRDKLYIAALVTPGIAKRVGRTLDIRPDWDSIKEDVMKELLIRKFGEMNPFLGSKLLDTRPSILVETNTWGDTYWGVCAGKGDNRLGHLLMDIREFLFLNSLK